ncbi:MAG: hypothetical protein Q9170_001967 [Blastenia crenularia]
MASLSTKSSPWASSSSSPRKPSLDHQPAAADTAANARIVPTAQRRGLLCRLTVVAEVERPKEFARSTKWTITFIVAAAAALVTTSENMLYPALQQTSSDLHASLSITNLSLSLSKISIAICPLWWSSFSETSGRRTVYIVSFTFFVIWSILAAISNSISMLIAMRVLSQSAASSVQAIGAGTIADIWEVRERGTAMGIFYLGPLVGGTTLGPVLGGVLTQTLGWRATQWFLAIYGGLILVLILFCLPETLEIKPPPLPRDAEKATQEAIEVNEKPNTNSTALSVIDQTAQRSTFMTTKRIIEIKMILFDPFRCLTYLRFPTLATTILLASFTFGTLALQSISVQDTFSSPPYSMSTIIVGLLYLPIGIGNVLGSIFGGRWSDYVMHREARKAGRYDEHGKLTFRPEDRAMENAWLGVAGYAAGFVWYGWAVQYHLHWTVAMLANFIAGFSAMIIFGLVTTMLTEFLPAKPASAVALNSMGRNFFACLGFAVAQPWLEASGNGWMFTTAAAIMVVSGFGIIEALRRWGAVWRESMNETLARKQRQ